jgi:hypothetical protein
MSLPRPHVCTAAPGAACCALLLGTHTLNAQTPAQSTAPDRPPSAIILAGGVDGLLRDGPVWTVSPALHLGYERPVGRAGFAWRAGLDLWTQGIGDRETFVNGSLVARDARQGRSWAYGASLYGTWGRTIEALRLRPYLLAGGGVHRITSTSRSVAGSTFGVSPSPDYDVAFTRLSLTGGAGLQADIGRVALFSEARLTYLPNITLGTPSGALPRQALIPITFGIRLPRW